MSTSNMQDVTHNEESVIARQNGEPTYSVHTRQTRTAFFISSVSMGKDLD